jgi:HPt (histidine-containing phosphotransfer) domain-containing protein
LGALTKYYSSDNPQSAAKEKQVDKTDQLVEVEESAPVSINGTAVTDLTFLREFAEGDESRMKKYVGMYLKLLPGNLEKIREARAEKDNEKLVKVLHSMRPHLTYLGMKESADLASSVEDVIREGGDESFIPGAANTILAHCQKSEIELNEWLSR